jgi:hypothetical protein
MTPDEFEKYIETPTPEKPKVTVSIAEVGRGDRTLMLGFTAGRDTLHAYLIGDLIHLHIYDSAIMSGVQTISHEAMYHFPASELVPSKRAYPHATDLRFAQHMKAIGFPLSFANFNTEANSAKPTKFRGAVFGLEVK